MGFPLSLCKDLKKPFLTHPYPGCMYIIFMYYIMYNIFQMLCIQVRIIRLYHHLTSILAKKNNNGRANNDIGYKDPYVIHKSKKVMYDNTRVLK